MTYEQIVSLLGYANDHDVWDGIQTQCSPALQAYYTRPLPRAPQP